MGLPRLPLLKKYDELYNILYCISFFANPVLAPISILLVPWIWVNPYIGAKGGKGGRKGRGGEGKGRKKGGKGKGKGGGREREGEGRERKGKGDREGERREGKGKGMERLTLIPSFKLKNSKVGI